MKQYTFEILEREEREDDIITFEVDIPHEKEVIRKTYDLFNSVKPSLIKSFDPEIKDLIEDVEFKVVKRKGVLKGIFNIISKPRTRWSKKKQDILWSNMNGQMTDGFGECLSQIKVYETPESKCYIEC